MKKVECSLCCGAQGNRECGECCGDGFLMIFCDKCPNDGPCVCDHLNKAVNEISTISPDQKILNMLEEEIARCMRFNIALLNIAMIPEEIISTDLERSFRNIAKNALDRQ